MCTFYHRLYEENNGLRGSNFTKRGKIHNNRHSERTIENLYDIFQNN